MKRINNRIILAVFALLFMLSFSLAPAARAHNDNDDNNGSSIAQNDESESEDEPQDFTELFKQRGHSRVEELSQRGQQLSAEKRQKSCGARKANLERRMQNAVRHAENHKAVFDKIYARVKSFHDTNKLNAANYDELVAAADTAQTDAANAVNALKTLDVNVDCASDNLADNISSFREAVKGTRDELKAYRAAIVDVIKALNNSLEETENE